MNSQSQVRSFSIDTQKQGSSKNESSINLPSHLTQSYLKMSQNSKSEEKQQSQILTLSQQLLVDVRENRLKSINLILDQNPQIDLISIRDESEKTILHHIAMNNNSYFFEIFIKHQVKILDQKQKPINVLILEWLNCKDVDGFCCVHYAALRGNNRIIDLFHQNNGCILEANHKGVLSFHIAAQSNQAITLAYLKEYYHVHPSIQDDAKSTALHSACLFGSTESVIVLLSWDVNINHQDIYGFTPLHLAILSGNAAIVKFLLKKGASTRIKNFEKKDARQLAIKSSLDIQKIIQYSSSCFNTSTYFKYLNYSNQRSKSHQILFMFLFLVNSLSLCFLAYPFINEAYIILTGIGLQLISFMFYIICSWSNPGYLDKHKKKMYYSSSKESKLYDLFQQLDFKEICCECCIIKPRRSKHCDYCNRCVGVYDHHCPWIDKCVGMSNYAYFILFITTLFFTVLLNTLICIQIFYQMWQKDMHLQHNIFPEYDSFVRENPNDLNSLQLFLLPLICSSLVLISVVVGILIWINIINLCANQTSYERLVVEKQIKQGSAFQTIYKAPKSNIKNCYRMCFTNRKKYEYRLDKQQHKKYIFQI